MKKRKIAFIEDEEGLVFALRKKLKDEGFDLITANNGIDSLALIEKEKPDMILLDIVLPKMEGFTVLRELKKTKSIKNIPVIVLSNLGQDEDVAKAMHLGAVDYMIKAETEMDIIIQKINKYLK